MGKIQPAHELDWFLCVMGSSGNQASTRLSESGSITNFMENKTSKRRIITLSDQTGSVDVKMWESHVNNVTSQNDVTTICFTVDVYMGRVSLNSNTSTTLQIYLRLPDDLKIRNIENIVNLILLMIQSSLLKPRRTLAICMLYLWSASVWC
uniref:Uncharacterized protein n=1 Tax=Magallana gigas TaxID=29159 RepID=K1RTR4_MAGGI